MAIQTQPSRISEPFAGSGTKNVIPATNATPSASQAASWASGFPPECSQPISAGGCPVPRNDMNGVLNWLSQGFAFKQDGGIWEWSALADYDLQRMVRGSDGLLYWSVAQSGPGVAAGAQDPTADDGTYWSAPPVKTVGAADSSGASASTAWVNAWFTSLFVPADLYVDAATGDDSNPGTQSLPYKTIAAARDFVRGSKLYPGQNVAIHVKSGDYSSETVAGSVGTTITYSAESGAVTVGRVYLQGPESIAITGEWTFVSNGQSAIAISRQAYMQLNNGFVANINNTNLSTYGNLIGVGNLGCLGCAYGAAIAIRINANPGASGATVSVSDMGLCSFSGATLSWTGSPTQGRKYIAQHNSALIGSGGSIPGANAGTTDSSSFYS